jgi:hypothetical protein
MKKKMPQREQSCGIFKKLLLLFAFMYDDDDDDPLLSIYIFFLFLLISIDQMIFKFTFIYFPFHKVT